MGSMASNMSTLMNCFQISSWAHSSQSKTIPMAGRTSEKIFIAPTNFRKSRTLRKAQTQRRTDIPPVPQRKFKNYERLHQLPPKQRKAVKAYQRNPAKVTKMQWTQVLVALGRLGYNDELEKAFTLINKPNFYHFNALLSCYTRMGNARMAEIILQRMKGAGVKPDQISYSILMQAYAKQVITFISIVAFKKMCTLLYYSVSFFLCFG